MNYLAHGKYVEKADLVKEASKGQKWRLILFDAIHMKTVLCQRLKYIFQRRHRHIFASIGKRMHVRRQKTKEGHVGMAFNN